MGNLYLTYREGFSKDLDSTFIENTDGSKISYGKLEEESAKYANGLSELGLQPVIGFLYSSIKVTKLSSFI